MSETSDHTDELVFKANGDPDNFKLAIFDKEQIYRYFLLRSWRPWIGRTNMWVMLNPSTADHTTDDPTIRRLRGFSERESDCNEFGVVNLYAGRATEPNELFKMENPEGVRNLEMICRLFRGELTEFSTDPRLIFAFGADRRIDTDIVKVIWTMANDAGLKPLCLGTTKSGAPRHPLYVKGDTPFEPWDLHAYLDKSERKENA